MTILTATPDDDLPDSAAGAASPTPADAMPSSTHHPFASQLQHLVPSLEPLAPLPLSAAEEAVHALVQRAQGLGKATRGTAVSRRGTVKPRPLRTTPSQGPARRSSGRASPAPASLPFSGGSEIGLPYVVRPGVYLSWVPAKKQATQEDGSWRLRWYQRLDGEGRPRLHSRSFPGWTAYNDARRASYEVEERLAREQRARSDAVTTLPASELGPLIATWSERFRRENPGADTHYHARRAVERACALNKWRLTTDVTLAGIQAFYNELAGTWKVQPRGPIYYLMAFVKATAKQHRLGAQALEFTLPKKPSHGKTAQRVVQRRHAWSDAQIRAIEAELLAPNRADAMTPPCGRDRRENQALISARTAATVYFLHKLAYYPMWLLQVRYAVRPRECWRLNVEHWSPSDATLSIPWPISKWGYRSFQVDRRVAAVFTRMTWGRPGDDALFLSQRGRRFHPGNQYRLVRRVLQCAGVPGTLYWTRHTACTRLIRRHQGDADLVASITGHEDYSTMLGYVHTTEDRQREVVDAYDADDDAMTPPTPTSGMSIAMVPAAHPAVSPGADDEDDSEPHDADDAQDLDDDGGDEPEDDEDDQAAAVAS